MEQAAAAPSAFQQPVGFIASGCLESPEPQLVMVESVMARRDTMLGPQDDMSGSNDVSMGAHVGKTAHLVILTRIVVGMMCFSDCSCGGGHPGLRPLAGQVD